MAPVELLRGLPMCESGKLSVNLQIAGKEQASLFQLSVIKKVKRRVFKDINKIHYITSLLSVAKDRIPER